MAEAETEAAAGAARGGANFLTRKLGPLPVGVWIGAAGLIWWFLQKRQRAAAGNPVQVSQTDPAGNVGAIDPATGYVYGTPQDSAALSQSGGAGGTTTGTGGSTVGGAYPDNDAWSRAAINYLVGLGIDPTAANAAIRQFLASQPLTPQQQADVNQAIQRLGAPPSPPEPGGAPTPIVQPPSPGTVYASNPPSGLTVAGKGQASLTLKWNSAVNATGYAVSWGTTPAATDGNTTVAGTNTTTTINGLKANTLYHIRVQATPAKSGDGYATTQGSTSNTAVPGPIQPPPQPPPAPKPAPPPPAPGPSRPVYVRAAPGDSFGSIAQKYRIPGGGYALYQYNLTTPQHSAEARELIRQRGPDLVVVNEQVFLPPA